jgi:hypothetical protein
MSGILQCPSFKLTLLTLIRGLDLLGASSTVHAKQLFALIIEPRSSTEKLPGIRGTGSGCATVFDQAIMQGKHHYNRLAGDAYMVRSQSPNHLRQPLVIRQNVYLVRK